MTKHYKINLETGSFGVKTGKISMKHELGYLIVSNKEKCTKLIATSPLDIGDIADILISLHIVLEVSLNTFYRHLISESIKKNIDQFEIMENIDNVSFIDKTIMFIYTSRFDFKNKLEDARKYSSIVGTIRDFSGARNKLLHGYSISTIFDDTGQLKQSKAKKMLRSDFLSEQMKKFRFIIEGMRFFFDCLDSEFDADTKEKFKKLYLSDDFLPYLSTKSTF